MKSIISIFTLVAVTATTILATPAPIPGPTLKPGWTTEQFKEYLSLETTDGWAGMENVTHYEVTQPGEVINFSSSNLEKRKGGRQFQAFSNDDCQGSQLFSASNFNCGVCITSTNGAAASGWMWREIAKSPYPTADWYRGSGCSGSVYHHQGIVGSELVSCDNADAYGLLPFNSVMLYQGC